LPVQLGRESAGITVPDYAFYMDFGYGFAEAGLATNVPVGLPEQMVWDEGPTDLLQQALLALLADRGVETTPNINTTLQADFDGDGLDEYLLLANTPRGQAGYPFVSQAELGGQSGSYVLVLFQDDDRVQVIHGDIRPYRPMPAQAGELIDIDHSYFLDLLGVYDLNGDGLLEICLLSREWEHSSARVYARDAVGNYRLVMMAESGL
jgi:hypothetical protein